MANSGPAYFFRDQKTPHTNFTEMPKFKFLSILLYLVPAALFAQSNAPLKGLVQGKLPNGLSYYILNSPLQKGEASFYLAQKAGSLLENDQQKGLAHFLEHMAFNGSKHFPNGVSDYLKSQGITKFNAYTSYDETVYNIDDVRTANKSNVDTCIYLLRDWCGNLALSTEEINKERGVIESEWRSRLNVQKRRQNAVAPSLFYKTKYVERDVIGDMDIIRNFSPSALKSFYSDWYRADMQAVIIVGDIDANEIEQKIKTIFGDLKVSPTAPKLPAKIHLVSNQEPAYVVFKDKELKQTTIQLFSRFESEMDGDYAKIRKEGQLRELFNAMAYRRLVEFMNADEEQFFTGNIAISKLLGNFYANTVSVTPLPGKEAIALKQILGVFEQIKRYGFTKEEIEKQKTVMYEKMESATKSTTQFKNSIYINKIKANYFNDVPMSTIKEGITNLMSSLLELEADEINAWVRTIDLNKNLVLEVDANENQKNILSKMEILSILNEASKGTINQKVAVTSINKLVDFDIKPGTIVSEKPLNRFDAKEWTLSNGVKVIYKHIKGETGEFSMNMHSFGGKSVLKSNEIPSANALLKLATRSGLYKYSSNELTGYLRNKKISINLSIDELNETLKGASTERDAQVLFEFVHLFFTKPKFDKADFDAYKQKLAFKYHSEEKNPMDAVSDSVMQATMVANDRSMKVDQKYFDAMNFETMKAVFTKAFSNTSDFTFYIVGNLDEQKAKELLTKYIATLPANPKNKANEYKLYNFAKKDKEIRKKFDVVMAENKGLIEISYVNNLKLSDQEKLAMDVLVYTLRNRYFRSIRENASGTYGVTVSPIVSIFPVDKQQLSINFQSDVNRVNELKPLVYKEITDISTNGISTTELTEAINFIQKSSEQAAKKEKGAAYWLSVLSSYQEVGIDVTVTVPLEERIKNCTAVSIKDFAHKFFDSAKLRDIVILQHKPVKVENHFHGS
ncbi:M16 family metallopeptidase [Pedobacter sp. MW01-1-1]|uniref:M16 family metallopeptidase n=1 Tax=Pedobacter sp. MW01-1-1 TaxID=3383027 RepID=UPI003FED461F